MKPEELVSEKTSKIGAKRRGGEGLNPEELVPDETRDGLRLFWYSTQDWMPEGPEDDECLPSDVQRAFDAGFYSALEELGIAQVVETSYRDHWIYDGESTSVQVDLTKGAVLIKPKDRTA